jgi:hypothetical protein
MRCGSECHPRTMKRRKNKWANTLTIGASTIWHGQFTNLLTASWARSTTTIKEGPQQGQLCCHCLSGHHHHLPLLRGPLGHSCEHRQRRMMVRTSMHLEYDVSMHGWAIRHRTTNHDLPLYSIPSNNHLHTVPPCLPYQELGNDNLQDGSLAPPGETSRYLMQKSQEIQETC